ISDKSWRSVKCLLCKIFWITLLLFWILADAEEVKSCCTKVSTAEEIDPIISFMMQRGSIPSVKAIIFETEQGEFCSELSPLLRRKICFSVGKRHHQSLKTTYL
uniref:Chemokine (C-C motif) ligand 34b, duplicate 1 n=1 Tax=Cyprinus carpio TaxID=7962 RepID=A0A8C1ZEV0_CYPCA